MVSIEKIIESIAHLPASAQILPRLQQLLRDGRTRADEVVELLQVDPHLSAQLIRLSNSVYYGSSERCHNVNEAVQRVGFSETYKLVGVIAMMELAGRGMPLYGLDSKDYWKRSVTCATLMRLLAELAHLNPDDAYTVGLLHGMGMVVLDHYHREHGLDFPQGMEPPLSPADESMLLGFTYAEAGAILLERWNFASAIFEPVRRQLDPNGGEEPLLMAHLLAFARDLQRSMAEDIQGLYEKMNFDEAALSELGLTSEEVMDAVLDAENAVEWLMSTL